MAVAVSTVARHSKGSIIFSECLPLSCLSYSSITSHYEQKTKGSIEDFSKLFDRINRNRTMIKIRIRFILSNFFIEFGVFPDIRMLFYSDSDRNDLNASAEMTTLELS